MKVGLGPLLVDLAERGIVQGFVLNGASAIHDAEVALVGSTSEDVGGGIFEGRYGNADETGRLFAEAARLAAREPIGLGTALGRLIAQASCAHLMPPIRKAECDMWIKTRSLTLVAVLALAACATPTTRPTSTVYSDDGVSELTAPASWRTRPNLGRSGTIRLADDAGENYLLVNSYHPHERDGAPLAEFAERVSARLKSNCLGGSTVTLKLKSADFKIRTRARALGAATQLASRIFEAGRDLLRHEVGNTPFRLIGIGVSNLEEVEADEIFDLIDRRAADAEYAIDRLRSKFGSSAIVRGLTFDGN